MAFAISWILDQCEVLAAMRGQNDTPYRILVVDDDTLICEVLQSDLLAAGYEAAMARNGTEALAKVEAQWFDMAIVDVCMPKMSGIELAWRLRDEHGVPCMFMSANSDRQTVDAAIAEGALGFLVKPVHCQYLLPALQTALARARDFRILRDSKHNLEETVSARTDISTAAGILMERLGLTQSAAIDRLTAYARSTGEKLEKVAFDLVNAQEMINRVGAPDVSAVAGEGASMMSAIR